MSARLVDRAPAKVNLTLRVLARRADGYHDIESLVAFADLADTLTFVPGDAPGLEMCGAGANDCGPAADNLVLKAQAALAAKASGLKPGRFILEKNIPVAAGLGGGSADAAAALRLLARANNFAPDDPRLMSAARDIGADVPVCLDSKSRIIRGAGETLSPALELPKFHAVLVNPCIPVATRDVFAAFRPGNDAVELLGEIPRERASLLALLGRGRNDLEPAAISLQPVIAEVLAALRALPACELARMSGSGATCFALFSSQPEAQAGAKALRAKYGGWWIHCGAIG